MSAPKTLALPHRLRCIAFAEAAGLLAADCDAADLACETYLSLTESEAVREYIRDVIVPALTARGTNPTRKPTIR